MTKRKIYIGEVVSDDDSTLRNYCSSEINDARLKPLVCESKFLVDVSHRTKVMVREAFNLVGKSKKPDEVKTIDFFTIEEIGELLYYTK